MRNQRMLRRGGVGVCAWTLIGVGAVAGAAFGQHDSGMARPIRADAYGNARPWYPLRRSVGGFSSDSQLEAARGLRPFGRRQSRRGAGAGFLLPGEALARLAPRPTGRIPGFGAISPTMAEGFKYYGGFGRRKGSGRTGVAAPLFARRYMLIEATAFSAPIRRVFLNRDLVAWPSDSLGAVGSVSGDEGEQGPFDVATPLEHVQQSVGNDHRRARENGWTWFQDGKYRQAARAFESVAALEPSDFESRIGELFSYASVGATRTSMVLMNQLHRRDPNPLGHDLSGRLVYKDPVEALQVEIRIRLFARSSGGVADAAALHVFVLWYLGQREEAKVAASNLAREHADSPYARWASWMEDTEQSGSGE